MHAHILSLPAERFQGQPEALVREIAAFSDVQGLPMIFRGSKMQLARASLAAMAPAPRLLVEFGTFVGVSALGWGAALRARQSTLESFSTCSGNVLAPRSSS
jgi:catechol O-methyltransferase